MLISSSPIDINPFEVLDIVIGEMCLARTINNNPVVQAGIRRLRSMGLVGDITMVNNNAMLIIISGESIIRFVKKRVDKSFNWNKKFIYYDKDNDALIAWIWQGSKPKQVKELEEKLKGGEEK